MKKEIENINNVKKHARELRGNTRGQVTIFIILALIIVVVIILLFVLFQPKKPVVADFENPQAYIENCVEDELKIGLNIIMQNGGYINQIHTVMWNNENISYLC